MERTSLTDKEIAQAEMIRAETAIVSVQLATDQMELAIKQSNWEIERAKNFHNGVYLFVGDIDMRSVTECIEILSVWDRLRPNKPIYIAFSSSGGDVMSGMALFDFISSLRRAHVVTTAVLGYGFSMAGVLLQAGTQRVIGAESYLLIHEISGMAAGKIGDMEDSTAFMNKVNERIIQIFVTRSAGKMTRAMFKKNWMRTDWWLDSAELLKYGFVDVVL